jgi:transcriptional regulator with XRE-family HTH domain
VATLKVSDRVGDLGGFLREQRESARLSLRQLASVAGISNPYLSQIERGLRRPSAEVLQQIAKGLQISAEALYLRAGILEESEGVQVEVAIQSDLRLTARQKRVLLDIYTTFRAENARSEVDSAEAPLAPTASGAGGGPLAGLGAPVAEAVLDAAQAAGPSGRRGAEPAQEPPAQPAQEPPAEPAEGSVAESAGEPAGEPAKQRVKQRAKESGTAPSAGREGRPRARKVPGAALTPAGGRARAARRGAAEAPTAANDSQE